MEGVNEKIPSDQCKPEDKELKDKTHSFQALNISATILDVVTLL